MQKRNRHIEGIGPVAALRRLPGAEAVKELDKRE